MANGTQMQNPVNANMQQGGAPGRGGNATGQPVEKKSKLWLWIILALVIIVGLGIGLYVWFGA